MFIEVYVASYCMAIYFLLILKYDTVFEIYSKRICFALS